MTGAMVLLALLTSVSSPEQTSRRVHEHSNHPDGIEIAPGPRWTSTYAPLEGGSNGASDGAMPAPQEGGGHASEEDDGWEGERWIDPNLVGPLEVDGPEGGEVAPEIGFGAVEVGGAGFEAPGVPTDPADMGGRGSSAESGSAAAHVEVEPERAPEPEPDAEPEPEPEQEPEPEPEVEPVPEPDLEPPPDAPEAASPLLTPPALGERSLVDDAVDPEPATPPPAPELTPAVDHRPFWFSLLGLGALGVLVQAYLRRRKTKPKKVAAAARSTKTTTPRQPSRDLDITQPELDYAAEIRAMLRAGLIAVGWRPQGRDLSKTAREVSAALPSTDQRRGAVRRLVAIAEKVHFAGSEATPADYHGARACVMEIHGREESS